MGRQEQRPLQMFIHNCIVRRGRPKGAPYISLFNHCLKFFLGDYRHAKLLGGLVLGGI